MPPTGNGADEGRAAIAFSLGGPALRRPDVLFGSGIGGQARVKRLDQGPGSGTWLPRRTADAVENRTTGWSTLSVFGAHRHPVPPPRPTMKEEPGSSEGRSPPRSEPALHAHGIIANPDRGVGIGGSDPWRNCCSSQGGVGLLPSRGRAGVVLLQLLDGPGAVALGDALQDAL